MNSNKPYSAFYDPKIQVKCRFSYKFSIRKNNYVMDITQIDEDFFVLVILIPIFLLFILVVILVILIIFSVSVRFNFLSVSVRLRCASLSINLRNHSFSKLLMFCSLIQFPVRLVTFRTDVLLILGQIGLLPTFSTTHIAGNTGSYRLHLFSVFVEICVMLRHPLGYFPITGKTFVEENLVTLGNLYWWGSVIWSQRGPSAHDQNALRSVISVVVEMELSTFWWSLRMSS